MNSRQITQDLRIELEQPVHLETLIGTELAKISTKVLERWSMQIFAELQDRALGSTPDQRYFNDNQETG